MKKIMKKALCTLLAAVSVMGCATSLTACETANPEVEITVEFNGKPYEMKYVLYRNTAPQTVKHFLWLAYNDYYDGLCVHDYQNNRLYTGAYTLDSTGNSSGLIYKKYFDTIKDFGDYSAFPTSVWMDKEKANPTYTLKGEFADNGVTVESGALKETFGSLTMYYYGISEESVANKKVYMLRADDESVSKCDYQYNYTTSMFYISMTPTTITNTSYCTFATISEDSVEVLEALQEAINAYDADEFVETKTVIVGEDDPLVGGLSHDVAVKVPVSSIVIKEVKVLKF